ncbi:MAG: transglutaminase family protein [Pseudomonadota bacterium]
MRYTVQHVSTVTYAAAVTQAQFNLRLVPWLGVGPGSGLGHGQTLVQQSLTIEPAPELRQDVPGPYCVNTTQIGFAAPLEKLRVTSAFSVDVRPPNLPGDGPAVEQVRREALALKELSDTAPAPYVFSSRIAVKNPEIAAWATPHLACGSPIVPAVSALMNAIHSEFTYTSGATTSDTPPHEAFASRVGVCQDFAHVMIIALRAAGLPAAYVSGYLRTLPPPGKPRLVGADAMHAWVNVWCGRELGWIGFDPTNNCLARGDHILIGMGRDYADVSPINGTFIGNAPQTMRSAVDVALAGEADPA